MRTAYAVPDVRLVYTRRPFGVHQTSVCCVRRVFAVSDERLLCQICVCCIRRASHVSQTEDKVVVGENGLQLVRVAFERLRSYSGAALVSWVQMNYGSGVHYTKAEQATSFTVTLGLGEMAA